MKTNKNNLVFTKNSIVELNKFELLQIKGGTSIPIASTVPCAGAAAALIVAAVEVVNDAGVAVGEAISREID